MALYCPRGFDVEGLRERIRATYERVAEDPEGEFHFHRGGRYAGKYLNYSPEDIAAVPMISVSRFAGVGNPHRIGALHAGETVLDHACGAGMDLLLAARRVGPRGRAIGIDMTRAMLDRARRGAVAAGVDGWTSLFHGVFEELPVDDASVDVVISNGVLNLAPDKRRVFAEVFRVLKPGGRLHLADVVVQCELPADALANIDLWTARIAGALREQELFELASATGFVRDRITERFDCFCNTAAEHAVSRDVRIGAVNFFARKPIVRMQ
ncbi:MAG TPA: methyltransferase domain-containing protein [Gammaproteobacteria bacterium]